MHRKDVEDTLNHIQQEYIIPCLKSKNFMDKFKLHSVIGLLKSTLDYTAQDLYTSINSGKSKKNIHFPYGKEQEYFHKSLNKNGFSHLASEYPKLYALIEELQPYKCNDDWIIKLSKIRNLTQHNGYIQPKLQRCHEGFSIPGIGYIPPNADVIISNCYIDGLPSGSFQIKNNQISFFHPPHPSFKIYEISNDTLFIYNEETIELIPFLQNCHDRIKKFTLSMYEEITSKP
ncbi:hypothetical protein [Neisseria sp.]|uniref:hypothetical protein n=1 Tax=Neisseria sp. TaxID=192066 RepID=UPI0035A061C8